MGPNSTRKPWDQAIVCRLVAWFVPTAAFEFETRRRSVWTAP
jgi:hypothetical protein